jgi:hypothetical protein
MPHTRSGGGSAKTIGDGSSSLRGTQRTWSARITVS